jgi:hypothetical protein
VLRSRRGDRKHKKATTQQKGAVRVQTASPVQSPRGDKLVHLAETDEAAQRMRSGEPEGWAIRCGAGGAATPITAAETIAEEDSRKAGFDPSLQTSQGDVPDPKSVAEALSQPDGPEWEKALLGEVGSCLELGVWEACELPPGKQALPSHFIMERKRDGRYKVRLVAGGHRQQYGVDFEETYESVCSYWTMCMILAVSAREGLAMRQFDIRTAFLNGELEEEVYMRPPAGAEGLAGGGSRVLHLKRALYGLRQASRAWNKRLEGELRGKGFVQSVADPALWILLGGGGTVLAMFYVDDGLVAARTAAEADDLVELVASMFAIRSLGEPQDFLGIQVDRDRAAGTISISQEGKALALAESFGLGGARKAIPMSPEVFSGLGSARDGDEMAIQLDFQRGIGSLLHLAQCTRPDIALAVGALAAYNSAPTKAHFQAMLDVVRYVGGTVGRGVTFRGSERPLGFWCDANFAACHDTRRSTTGWVATMYGGAVSWSSKKQPTTAASTMNRYTRRVVRRRGRACRLSRRSGRWAYSPWTLPLRDLF